MASFWFTADASSRPYLMRHSDAGTNWRFEVPLLHRRRRETDSAVEVAVVTVSLPPERFEVQRDD